MCVAVVGLFKREHEEQRKKSSASKEEQATLCGWTNQMLHATQEKREYVGERNVMLEKEKENAVTITNQHSSDDQR